MKVISEVIERNLTINDDTKITGIINGNVTIMPGTVLQLNGIVNGNLTISENAYSKISGIVNGDIINYGTIDVYGIVDKSIKNFDGKFTIHKDAVVNGIKH